MHRTKTLQEGRTTMGPGQHSSALPLHRDLQQHQLGRAAWGRRASDFPAESPHHQTKPLCPRYGLSLSSGSC